MEFLPGPTVPTVGDHERPGKFAQRLVAQVENVGRVGNQATPRSIQRRGMGQRPQFDAWYPAVRVCDERDPMAEVYERLAEPIHHPLSTTVQRRRNRFFSRIINRDVHSGSRAGWTGPNARLARTALSRQETDH